MHQCHLRFTRKIVGNTFHFLFTFLGCRQVRSLQVSDTDIIGLTRKIVLGYYS